MEEEQILFLIVSAELYTLSQAYQTNLSVITLGSFFDKLFVFLHLLVIGERDTVDSLQGVVL